MNMEQFQLLLEMIGSAGDGAFTLAILFMARGLVVGIIVAIIILVVVRMIIKVIKDLDRDERALKELRYLMLDEDTGYIDSSDLHRMKEFIRDNKKA